MFAESLRSCLLLSFAAACNLLQQRDLRLEVQVWSDWIVSEAWMTVSETHVDNAFGSSVRNLSC